MSSTDKRALRQAVRASYGGAEARSRESALICDHVSMWQVYREAAVVVGYAPLPWEADITPLLADALSAGKTLLLPRMEGERRMTLRRISRMDELLINRWHVPEPPEGAEIVPVEAVDLLLVPLEAVDAEGMRLGKGGGYYDALLAGARTFTLGAALSWQRVERVPREPWDQPLRALVDAEGITLFK